MRNHDHYSDDLLRTILGRVKTVAVVGASADPGRPSRGVMRFMAGRGYRVLAINPKLPADAIPGTAVYGSLADIPEPIDMVDVFRNNAAVEGVVDDALALRPPPSVIWMQLGVRVDAAAARAEAAGIDVVMNRCPKIEHNRLFNLGQDAPDLHRARR